MITRNDVTQSLMTKRRIEYWRLCFEGDVVVGDKERIDGRSRIYSGQRLVLYLCLRNVKRRRRRRKKERCARITEDIENGKFARCKRIVLIDAC